MRTLSARGLMGRLSREAEQANLRGNLANAFRRNTLAWRSVFAKLPTGWGRRTRKRLHRIIEDTDSYVQSLNDRFTDPSGEDRAAPPAVKEEIQTNTVSEEKQD